MWSVVCNTQMDHHQMSDYSQIIYGLLEEQTNFGLDLSVVYVISSLYVLNCFKYFGTKCLKK